MTTCDNCKYEFDMRYGAKSRDVPQYAGAVENYIECPKCGAEYHSHFISAELQPMYDALQAEMERFKALQADGAGVDELSRALTEYKTQRSKYNRAFGRFNSRVRRKLGMPQRKRVQAD